MPEFEITDKNTGRTYVLTAPDAQTAAAAWQKASGAMEQRPAKDVQSGDEARAMAAGDTRSKMAPKDISYAYDTAQSAGNRDEQKAMAKAYVERERADSPTMMRLSDIGRSVARGVPVIGGLLDEGNAALDAAFGGNYDKRLDYERARDSTYDEAHPVASTLGQLGGGVASGLGIASKVAPMLSGMAKPIALGTGVGGGAVLGGADGFTRGEGFDDRLKSAAIGGTVGGLIGGAAPILGAGINKATNYLVDKAVRRDTLKPLSLTPEAADIVTRAMQADGSLGGTGAANIAKAGPNAMVADAGPNTAQLLDAATQRGGPGMTRAREAVAGRVADATTDLNANLNQTLGQPKGAQTTIDGIRTGGAPSRSAAYDAAYASPIDYATTGARRLEELLKRVPASALQKANSLMAVEGNQSQQIMAKLDAKGNLIGFERLPDVRQLDYLTRALNDVAKRGDGAGMLGGNTAEGRAVGLLSKDIRQTLRKLVPQYGKALDTAADDIAAKEAFETGLSLLSSGTRRDEVARAIKGMSRAERDLVRQGVRSHLDDAMANVQRTMMDPNVDAREAAKAIKDFSSRAARDKIRYILGKDADAFFQRIDEAAAAFNLQGMVAQNSKTATRQMAKDAVDQMTEPGPIGMAMRGEPVKAGRRLFQDVMGTGPQKQLDRQDQIWDEVVKALVEKRGTDAQRLLMDLNDANNRKGQGAQFGALLSRLGAGAIGGGAYSGINSLTATK